MLKINIIAVGKNKEPWVDEAIEQYSKFLRKYITLSLDYIPDKSSSKKLSEAEIMQLEAELIRSKVKSNYSIALTDRGKSMDSLKFARWLEKLKINSGGACDFIIGGIYGIEKDLLASCRETLSLSPMTMSHQLVRPVLLEQLYRGFSILGGGKYHK